MAFKHPADINPEDGCIGINEVTAYGSAWKQGLPWGEAQAIVPIGYYTRAGFCGGRVSAMSSTRG